jgi:hypothetical protein
VVLQTVGVLLEEEGALGKVTGDIGLEAKPSPAQLPVDHELPLKVTHAVLHHLPQNSLELLLPELLLLAPELQGHLVEPFDVELQEGKHQAAFLDLLGSPA